MKSPAATAEIHPVQPSPDWLAEEPSAVPATSPSQQYYPFSEALRRFTQALVVFLCLFLVIRTVALEPFGVPTGSMAPTLIGNHRAGDCPRCGFPIRVGEPGNDGKPIRFEACQCPHCFAPVDLSKAPMIPGDRLMVDKTAFISRRPRRWEVAVFHCPADLTKPYVKRVGGLPGELIQIAGGDIYADGQLVRKTLANLRELRIPVFDLSLAPKDGWFDRWLIEPIADPSLPPASAERPSRTVDHRILHDNAIFIDATRQPIGLTYRHWNLNTRDEEPVGDWLAYNGGPSERRDGFARGKPHTAPDPVHDFYVVFDLEVVSGSGSFACRLGDGADTVRADLPVASRGSPRLAHDGDIPPILGSPVRLTAGNTYRIEFAFVDRRASLAVDGVEATEPLDLPFDPPSRPRRGGMSRPFQLGARGISIVIRNFKLYRDIHYLGTGSSTHSWRLKEDEFFMLGDNTANSHDSRLWTIDGKPAPGVPGGNFIGKPFLIHQPMRLARVPLDGSDRTVQTLDWSRFRWLR